MGFYPKREGVKIIGKAVEIRQCKRIAATGSADAAVASLLNGTLIFNPDTVCSHHHHGEGHDCGSHSCGEDKHGCAGNH